jgi:DNA-binding response OmpR family regulator
MTVASMPAPYATTTASPASAEESALHVVVHLSAHGDNAARVAAWLTRALSTLAAECGSIGVTVGAGAAPGGTTGEVIPLPRSPRDRARVYLHTPSRRVLRDGVPLTLTRLEYDLLLFLCDHPHRVHERRSLLQQVWGYAGPGRSRTLDVHIRRLRHKLGPDLPLIGTVRGVGYRLEHAAQVWVDHGP